MSYAVGPRPPARGRRRLFQPGQTGNPAGQRRGSRNKATLAGAILLQGAAPGLTRRAVEAALVIASNTTVCDSWMAPAEGCQRDAS
jgi:hypothetical protein